MGAILLRVIHSALDGGDDLFQHNIDIREVRLSNKVAPPEWWIPWKALAWKHCFRSEQSVKDFRRQASTNPEERGPIPETG